MDLPRSLTRSPLSLQAQGIDYWTKLPTDRLQAALAAEPENSSNAVAIRTVLETRNSGQLAKTMLAVAESNRALSAELQKISAQNDATSQRLSHVTVAVCILAAIAITGAVIALLKK